MWKYLAGVATGILLAALFLGLVVVALIRFQQRPAEIADNSVITLRLSGDIPEKPPLELPAVLGDSGAALTVPNLWLALRSAASDPKIKAIMLEPDGLSAGWAKLEELRSDLERFRKSGKPVFAYLRSPGTRDYYVALAADRIYLGPQEALMLKGLRAESMFFKKTLEKLGVGIEVEHAGKYKDAGDMFTRTDMSPESREVIDSVLDELYGNLVSRIASARHRSPEEVRALIDAGPYTASRAIRAGLVDALRFEDQAWGELQTRLRSGEPKKISMATYIKSAPAAGSPSRNRIALVVASGEILRGDPSDDGAGESMLTSHGFVKLINRVANDSSIRGVVVRIDSPGGEVTASDEIWREMNLLSKKKPTVISMSDAAASGGYYMAMTGDPIVAYPGTMTGSIGVVFGKPNLHGLYEKLGVTKDSAQRGRNAGIDSDYKPLTPEERQILKDGIDETYSDFVAKVANARRKPVGEVEPLAQGRVWLGSQAHARGLVDQLGGLETALDLAKKRANIPAGEAVRVQVLPQPVSILDYLLKRSSPEGVLESKLATIFGDAPFRAWTKGGFLRMMPYWVEVR